MNARGLLATLIAVLPACTAGTGDPAAGFRVDRIERTVAGQPYLLVGELGRIDAAAVAADLGPAISGALPAIAEVMRVPAAELAPVRAERDALGMIHVRLAQQKHGLPVVGGDVVLHASADGVVRSVNGTARDRDLPASPDITAADATSRALAATPGGTAAPRSELRYVISTGDGELYLAWEVEVTGGRLLDDLVYVDALSGRVVDRHPQVFTARNRIIFDGQGQVFPPGTAPQVGAEGNPPAGDAVARAAYDNTGATYDCYQALYQRDSYDGMGGTLTSMVHITFSDGAGGTDPNNAAWIQARRMMVYGDGDGSFFGPTPLSLDVTAHELTHGVTAATAGLIYQNESGALNEAMSDVFGAVCEAWKDGAVSADTWLVGEDIFTPNTAGDALRYMANPTADSALYPPSLGGSRDFYPERYQGASDGGGVHLNSGIANLAFYLLTTGGKHPRNKSQYTVPAIGIEKAGRIFNYAHTKGYFTATTDFAQARAATEVVAQTLYPNTATRTAVALAWAAVGVGGAPPADVTPPTVQIVEPMNGAKVQPGFAVKVTASDEIAVTRVELLLDGSSIGTLTAPPYDFMVPGPLAARGYTLAAVAYDSANQATATAMVTVELPCTGKDCEDPGGGDGGGCCSTAGDGRRGAGSLLLALATALALRRRRRR